MAGPGYAPVVNTDDGAEDGGGTGSVGNGPDVAAPGDRPVADRPTVGDLGDIDPTLDEAGLPVERPRSVLRKMASNFISFALVIAIFWFLYTRLSGVDFSSAFALITPASVVVVCLLGVVNLASNWPPIVVSLPGLRIGEAAQANLASAAVSNTIPEGGAVATGMTYAMFHSFGRTLEAVTLSLMTTGIWTNLTRYSLMALALLLVAANGIGGSTSVTLAVVTAVVMVVLVALFGLVLRSESFAERLGRIGDRVISPVLRRFHKPPFDAVAWMRQFRTDLVGLVHDRWLRLTTTMTISQLTACLVLFAAVRMMGIGDEYVPVSLIVVAYAAQALVSLMSPTPGGMGVSEAALLAVLGVAVPDTLQDQLVAAVVLFRIAVWLLPIPLGAGAYLYWRMTAGKRRRGAAAVAPAGATTDATTAAGAD